MTAFLSLVIARSGLSLGFSLMCILISLLCAVVVFIVALNDSFKPYTSIIPPVKAFVKCPLSVALRVAGACEWHRSCIPARVVVMCSCVGGREWPNEDD